MPIRVALVDDQTLVREGIRGLLKLSDAVTVGAEASDGDQVLAVAESNSIDVFLMDIRMPRLNGIEAIKSLRNAGISTPVIILTTFDDHELVLQGMQVGAQGYLLKDVSLESLIAATESVHRGETIVQPAITDR